MSYKVKSLIYFLVFIAASMMYHNMEQQPTSDSSAPVALLDTEKNTKMVQDITGLQELQ